MKKLLLIPAFVLISSASYANSLNYGHSAPSVSVGHSFNTTNVNKAILIQNANGGTSTSNGAGSSAGGISQVGVITQQSPIGGF